MIRHGLAIEALWISKNGSVISKVFHFLYKFSISSIPLPRHPIKGELNQNMDFAHNIYTDH